MSDKRRSGSFTLRQAGQRNSILASVQYVHDSLTGRRTIISTCSEGCLACLVEQTIRQAEFAPANSQTADNAGSVE